MPRFRNTDRSILVLSALALGLSWRIPAAELDEVIVTAQKRAESVQDVPSTVSALDRNFLESRGATELRDYAAFIPGMTYSGTAFVGERSGPDITLRGVSNSRLTAFEVSIATLTTGFVIGELPSYPIDLRAVDIERVEVLKGPQGTLYGSSSMGGTVKIVPAQPDATAFSGNAAAGLSFTEGGGENYNGSLTLNAPLRTDVLALRANAYHFKDAGFIDARIVQGLPAEQRGFDTSLVDVEDINEQTTSGGSVALRFTPNDSFDATLRALVQKQELDSLPNHEPLIDGNGSDLYTELYLLQPNETEYKLASLEMSYDFGPLTLYSVSGWLNRDFANASDFTGITYGALGGNNLVPVPAPAPVTFLADSDVVSQELRLQGEIANFFGSSSVDARWTLGYFYQKEDRSSGGGVDPGPEWDANAMLPVRPSPGGTGLIWLADYNSDYENSSGFADVTFAFADRLEIGAGVRYTTQKLESLRADIGGVFGGLPNTQTFRTQDLEEDAWTPRGSLSYRLTDDHLIYATASKGFRLGGANPVAALQSAGCQAALAAAGLSPGGAFESDEVWNYEVGAKTEWADRRLIANISFYRIDWTDLQASTSLSNFGNCGSAVTANVGAARIDGIEAELRALVTDDLQLALSASFADSEITDASNTAAKKGDSLKNIPDFNVAVGAQYAFRLPFDLEGQVRADYIYVDERNFNDVAAVPNPIFFLPSYDILNVRVGASTDRWTLELFAENVLDETADLGITTVAGGPGIYSSGSRVQRFVATNQPRTIGLAAKWNF